MNEINYALRPCDDAIPFVGNARTDANFYEIFWEGSKVGTFHDSKADKYRL
jgi:hypothetical protein